MLSKNKQPDSRLEKKVQDLEQGTKDLKDTRSALMNILEDVEEERGKVEIERDRTSAIIKSFADGLLFIEGNKVTLINPKIEKFFDISEEDILGITLTNLAKDKRFKSLFALIEKRGDSFSREELMWTKDLAVEISSTPVFRDKKNTGKIIIIHDISREKMIERLNLIAPEKIKEIEAHNKEVRERKAKEIENPIKSNIVEGLDRLEEANKEEISKREIQTILNLLRKDGPLADDPERENLLKRINNIDISETKEEED